MDRGSLTMKLSIASPAAQTIAADTPLFANVLVRRAEKIILTYFVFMALMLSVRQEPILRRAFAWTVPLVLLTAIFAESRNSKPWSRVVRDWIALGLILVAYREVDWLGGKQPLFHLQDTWIAWDRVVLDQLRLRAAIEYFGGIVPAILEAVYLSLYAIPPLCLGLVYWFRGRDRVDRFSTTLFAGAFCAYALLPFFPSLSPRVAYPNQDLPHVANLWRYMNVWLLDHCDISTSVFPSGHVAVAFSSALGLLRAIPEHRWVWLSFLAAAVVVFTATIYGRYHYAADGLASIAISVLAWLCTAAWDRDA